MTAVAVGGVTQPMPTGWLQAFFSSAAVRPPVSSSRPSASFVAVNPHLAMSSFGAGVITTLEAFGAGDAVGSRLAVPIASVLAVGPWETRGLAGVAPGVGDAAVDLPQPATAMASTTRAQPVRPPTLRGNPAMPVEIRDGLAICLPPSKSPATSTDQLAA